MKLKIGQEITVTEDFEIENGFSKDKIQIKKGDKGFIDSNSFIHYISGAARGKLQKIKDIEVLQEYDHENIAKIIMKYLNYFDLKEILLDYDIEVERFEDKVIEALDEIL